MATAPGGARKEPGTMDAMNVLSTEAKQAIADAMRANTEIIIRDMAGKVVSLVRSRREHPSYGTTKANVREAASQMDGAIGLYMMQAGQARHPYVPLLAEFLDDSTTVAVERARADLRGL